MANKRAVFVLGTMERDAVKQGVPITERTYEMLNKAAKRANIDATFVFAVQDELLAGKNKQKIGITRIREERPRVLTEIGDFRPDFVMCFGPIASASVFDRGSLKEAELLRQQHFPFTGMPKLPVYVTFGMENVRYKAGLAKWISLDLEAAVHGWGKTQWGKYDILLPNNPAWHICPDELLPDTVDRAANCPVRVVGYDLETYPGLDPWHPDARIRMAIIGIKPHHAWVVQATPDGRLPDWVYQLIENPNIVKAGSNIKYDYRWHRRFGHKIVNMWDTSTHEHIIDESNPKKDLKSLAFRYAEWLADYSRGHRKLVKERGGWDKVRDDEQYNYAGADGEASIAAYQGQAPIIERMGLDRPARLFRDLYYVLAEMEHHGACIDLGVNARLDELYVTKLAGLRSQITKYLGPVSPDSPKLAKELKKLVPTICLTVKELKGVLDNPDDQELTTDKAVLQREAHKHPVIPMIMEYRSYRHRRSTFITAVRDKHAVERGGKTYLHSSFNTAIVETYRLSCSNPPLHSTPRKDNDDAELTIKKQFVSRFEGGSILEADQSQIEIRFAAWLSGDKKMIEAINSGEDIHRAMAAIMLDKPADQVTDLERQECKARTFLILYGGGAAKLASDLKISRAKAKRMIDDYFETFSGLKAFIDRTHREVRGSLEVETVFGFRRRFVEPEYWDSKDGYTVQRQAFNTKIQNGAACVTYCSMIWLQRELENRRLKSKLFLQVHDSMLVDVYPGEEKEIEKLVRHSMENVNEVVKGYGVDFNIALKCDVAIGPSWGEVVDLPEPEKVG